MPRVMGLKVLLEKPTSNDAAPTTSHTLWLQIVAAVAVSSKQCLIDLHKLVPRLVVQGHQLHPRTPERGGVEVGTADPLGTGVDSHKEGVAHS